MFQKSVVKADSRLGPDQRPSSHRVVVPEVPEVPCHLHSPVSPLMTTCLLAYAVRRMVLFTVTWNNNKSKPMKYSSVTLTFSHSTTLLLTSAYAWKYCSANLKFELEINFEDTTDSVSCESNLINGYCFQIQDWKVVIWAGFSCFSWVPPRKFLWLFSSTSFH